MFHPGAQGLILVAMVMTMVRNAIEQGTFPLALANHPGIMIPWDVIFIYLKHWWHGITPQKSSPIMSAMLMHMMQWHN